MRNSSFWRCDSSGHKRRSCIHHVRITNLRTPGWVILGAWFLAILVMQSNCVVRISRIPYPTFEELLMLMTAPLATFLVRASRRPSWIYLAFSSAAIIVFLRMHPVIIGWPTRYLPGCDDASLPWLIRMLVPTVALVFACRLASTARRKYQVERCAAVQGCFVCGYFLVGNVSGVCPECGTAVPPIGPGGQDAARTRALFWLVVGTVAAPIIAAVALLSSFV